MSTANSTEKTCDALVCELRREAAINAICGSEEWTELLTACADRMEHMKRMLLSVHASTDLNTARRRALKGLRIPKKEAR